MAGHISARARTWFTDFETAIPDIIENIYEEKTNPNGVISLALAENHLIHEPLTQYLNQNFHIDEDLACTYSGTTLGGPHLRKVMASHINKYFFPVAPIQAENVLFANGVSAICSMLSFGLGDHGDGVLLMRPIYGKFENDWGVLGGMKTLYVDMGDIDPFSEASVERYEKRLQEAQAAGTKVVALQISNPHNPSGICYPTATLRALMAFCQKHTIHLVSDEIYALTIFPIPPLSSGSFTTHPAFPSLPSPPPQIFTSVLSIPTSDPSGGVIIDPGLLHVEYGLAKDFAAAGLHIGCLITCNDDLTRAFDAIGLLHSPSGASCALTARILEDDVFVREIVSQATRMLGENYAIVTQMLEEAGIGYWRGGNAGYFLWVDLSKWLPRVEKVGREEDEKREQELAKRLLDEAGVWLNPGQENGEIAGWFRLIFSHRRVKVVEGVRRIIKCLCGKEMSELAMRLSETKM